MIGITLIRSDTMGRRYFEQGRIVIGSSPESDIQVEGASVRPAHALIQITQGIVVIQPADRHALVTIGGIPVSGVHALEDSQTFKIASVDFMVRWDEPEARTDLDIDRDEAIAAVIREVTEMREAPRNDRPGVSSKVSPTASSDPVSQTGETVPLPAYQEPGLSNFEAFPTRDDTGELDEELLKTHRVAVSQLVSAFALVDRRPKLAFEEDPTTEVKKSASRSSVTSALPPPPPKAREAQLDADCDSDHFFDTDLEVKDASQLDRIQLGRASESHTYQLSGQQVESLYKLYRKKKMRSLAEEERTGESSEELDVEDFSLSQILLKGPEAFGVRTWDDVAEEAATLQRSEDDPVEGLARLGNLDDDATLRKVTFVTLVGLMGMILGMLLLMTSDSLFLGEEDETIKDIDVSELQPVEHLPRTVRCFSEAECVAMATGELEIAKITWDNRDSAYENRFRAFEHADRARQLLTSQELEMTEVPELEGIWNQTRDELDAIFQSLRVSFFIAISQKRYEDAFETLNLAEVYFPTPRAREKRWAENLKRTLKKRGIEARVNHQRAVRGRWN